MQVRTAVIPAAGLGTRFLPATKAVPKELLPIIDTPALQLIIDEAVGAGIDHIVIVTNRNKPAIEAYFEASDDVVAKLRSTERHTMADRLRVDRPRRARQLRLSGRAARSRPCGRVRGAPPSATSRSRCCCPTS